MKTCKCGKTAAKGRSKCYPCIDLAFKTKNPEKYAYKNLKHNAKNRGKEFAITFEEFKEFCFKTEYIKGKGKSCESLSIDRIDNEKGYTIDNIRVLTLSDNSKKHTKKIEFDFQYTKEFYVSHSSFTPSMVNEKFMFISDENIIEIKAHNAKNAKNKIESYTIEYIVSKTKKGTKLNMPIEQFNRLIRFDLLKKVS